MDDTKTVQIIHRFGLESVLSFEDDPFLWASAIKKYWIKGRGFSNQNHSLYLDVAVADHESMVGLRVIENWRFEHRMDGRFKPERWNEQAPVSGYSKGFPFEIPFWHIAIERPSKNKNSILVYDAVILLSEGYGFAETHIWRWYKPWVFKALWAGGWRQTMRRIYFWRGRN
ncbi:MAG: hypothetical protein WBB69_03435 [Anaerolineales bacterium]